MQSQINAIAQLLKTNNATASQIEEILVQVLSNDASWENTSTVEELPDSLNQHDLYTPDEIESVMRKLWRSRITLNNARINAEEVDLEDFLSRFDEPELVGSTDIPKLNAQMPIHIPRLHKLIADRDRTIAQLEADNQANRRLAYQDLIEERDREIELLKTKLELAERQSDNLDREIQLLKTQLELANGTAKELIRDESRDHFVLLEAIAERNRIIKIMETEIDGLRLDVAGNKKAKDSLGKRVLDLERQIENLNLTLDAAKKPTDDLVMECDQLRRDNRDRDTKIEDLLDENADLRRDRTNLRELNDRLRDQINRLGKTKEAFSENDQNDTADRDRQIQELQTSLRNHHEQFDDLKSHSEVTLKAIAMNLNALKGDRKPDQTKEVDGVMVKYRDYDDNLTHNQKTLIIEHLQRAIANEARKLKGATLKDFSFDEMPF